ncbi:MAG TPA: winged helix-turn-helix domain-containing protein [Terriglobales bacterium]|jgi:two-component system, OmpR family, KDP operon response regulator KdpE|nr:winged helix-turn-helix domain-containing protein [Terriglobales bacterium]
MNRNWSLRQLFAQTCDKGSAQDPAKERTSLTGRIRFGDFKIDLDERSVTLRDQELRLTSEEFDVLVFLASHPRSLVTPQTVVATSSTANQLRQPMFLRTLISLRKKLDAAGHGKHYLQTEPWVIYRFDPTASSA